MSGRMLSACLLWAICFSQVFSRAVEPQRGKLPNRFSKRSLSGGPHLLDTGVEVESGSDGREIAKVAETGALGSAHEQLEPLPGDHEPPGGTARGMDWLRDTTTNGRPTEEASPHSNQPTAGSNTAWLTGGQDNSQTERPPPPSNPSGDGSGMARIPKRPDQVTPTSKPTWHQTAEPSHGVHDTPLQDETESSVTSSFSLNSSPGPVSGKRKAARPDWPTSQNELLPQEQAAPQYRTTNSVWGVEQEPGKESPSASSWGFLPQSTKRQSRPGIENKDSSSPLQDSSPNLDLTLGLPPDSRAGKAPIKHNSRLPEAAGHELAADSSCITAKRHQAIDSTGETAQTLPHPPDHLRLELPSNEASSWQPPAHGAAAGDQLWRERPDYQARSQHIVHQGTQVSPNTQDHWQSNPYSVLVPGNAPGSATPNQRSVLQGTQVSPNTQDHWKNNYPSVLVPGNAPGSATLNQHSVLQGTQVSPNTQNHWKSNYHSVFVPGNSPGSAFNTPQRETVLHNQQPNSNLYQPPAAQPNQEFPQRTDVPENIHIEQMNAIQQDKLFQSIAPGMNDVYKNIVSQPNHLPSGVHHQLHEIYQAILNYPHKFHYLLSHVIRAKMKIIFGLTHRYSKDVRRAIGTRLTDISQLLDARGNMPLREAVPSHVTNNILQTDASQSHKRLLKSTAAHPNKKFQQEFATHPNSIVHQSTSVHPTTYIHQAPTGHFTNNVHQSTSLPPTNNMPHNPSAYLNNHIHQPMSSHSGNDFYEAFAAGQNNNIQPHNGPQNSFSGFLQTFDSTWSHSKSFPQQDSQRISNKNTLTTQRQLNAPQLIGNPSEVGGAKEEKSIKKPKHMTSQHINRSPGSSVEPRTNFPHSFNPKQPKTLHAAPVLQGYVVQKGRNIPQSTASAVSNPKKTPLRLESVPVQQLHHYLFQESISNSGSKPHVSTIMDSRSDSKKDSYLHSREIIQQMSGVQSTSDTYATPSSIPINHPEFQVQKFPKVHHSAVLNPGDPRENLNQKNIPRGTSYQAYASQPNTNFAQNTAFSSSNPLQMASSGASGHQFQNNQLLEHSQLLKQMPYSHLQAFTKMINSLHSSNNPQQAFVVNIRDQFYQVKWVGSDMSSQHASVVPEGLVPNVHIPTPKQNNH